MKKCAVITCKSTKKDYACKTKEMYSDSIHFKIQTPFIEKFYDDFKICSLKYGILNLDDEIEPYQITLTKGSMIKKTPTLDEESLTRWALKVTKSIAKLATEFDIVDLHLSSTYFEPIQGVLQIPGVRLVKTPHPLQMKANYSKALSIYEEKGKFDLDVISSYVKWRNMYKDQLLNKKTVLPWI